MNDPFNEFGIFFINFFFVCILLGIIAFPYDIIINKYLCNSSDLTEALSILLKLLGHEFPRTTFLIFLFFLMLYFILYLIYLFIIYEIPPTGIQSLFIPIREILLKIHPLPLLLDKGVFHMYDNIFNFFNGYINFKDLFREYYEFSKDNIISYIRIFNPDIDLIIENLKNKNDNSNENDNANNEVDVCINSQAPITTPDMNFVDLFINEIKSTKNNIKCNLNSIKSYIKTTANDAKMEATDNINHIND